MLIKCKGTNSERRKKISIGIQRIREVRAIYCLRLQSTNLWLISVAGIAAVCFILEIPPANDKEASDTGLDYGR